MGNFSRFNSQQKSVPEQKIASYNFDIWCLSNLPLGNSYNFDIVHFSRASERYPAASSAAPVWLSGEETAAWNLRRENWIQDVFKYKYRNDIYEYRYTCKCIYIQIHYATTHANGEVTARHSIYLTSLHLYIQRLNRNNNHV